jgi:hypothetical protein
MSSRAVRPWPMALNRRLKRWSWMSAVALVIAAGSCRDSDVGPTSPPERPRDEEGLVSRAGIQVSRSRMNELLAQITREVAIALADAEVRGKVYAGLQASPYREHKLDFNTYLRDEATPLLRAMAAARVAALSPAPARVPTAAEARIAVLATLDSIMELEFYMPVAEHWTAWRGDSRLLVAGALDDHDVPIGFDLTGRPVPLRQDQPPAIPTLVVVRNETDFSSPSALANAPEVPRATTVEAPGVYMTNSRIYNPGQYEGWTAGAPEFEIHAFVQSNSGSFIDTECAGAEQNAPLKYDQNGEYWNGRVLVILETGIGTHQAEFQVWEDDTGACKPGEGRPPRTTGATRQAFSNFGARVLTVMLEQILSKKQILAVILSIPAVFDLIAALNYDDPVGAVSHIAPQPGCWPESGPAQFSIVKPSNGQTVGTVYLDITFGQRTPLCPFTMSWAGATTPYEYTDAAWEAWPAYGKAPYTFSWYRNGTLVATGPSYAANVGGIDFQLRIDGTDALGATATYTGLVHPIPAPPPCIPTPPEITCPGSPKRGP